MAATSTGESKESWELVRDLVEGLGVTLRRMWTIPALVAVMVASTFNDLSSWPYPLGLAIMLFTIAAEGFSRTFVWSSAVLGAILLLLPWKAQKEFSWAAMIYLVPEMLLFTVAPTLFGLYLRALSLRAADNERRRQLEAEQIRAEERARLANEIHDIVAHRVSLMVVHTGALKLAATDDKIRDTADLIRSSGRRALEELREVVSVLRSEESPSPLEPVARLVNIAALIDESREAGQYVEVNHTGEARKVPSLIERTAYRVVQESLTNVRKHAPGSRVRIDLIWQQSALDIRVTNGAAGTKTPSFPASGFGLRSLRERVSLVSGTFEAGRTRDGGWAVHASLPYGGGS